MDSNQQDFSRLLSELSQIGIALSAERDHGRLLEMILTRARDMTGADGGTLYSCTEEKTLKFEIMLSTSLGLDQGLIGNRHRCLRGQRLDQLLVEA